MLKFGAVDNPHVLARVQLPNADSTPALALAEEVVSLPELVGPRVARAPSMALANEGLPDFAIEVRLVTAFRVSYSGKVIELVEQLHELVFVSDNPVIQDGLKKVLNGV